MEHCLLTRIVHQQVSTDKVNKYKICIPGYLKRGAEGIGTVHGDTTAVVEDARSCHSGALYSDAGEIGIVQEVADVLDGLGDVSQDIHGTRPRKSREQEDKIVKLTERAIEVAFEEQLKVNENN